LEISNFDFDLPLSAIAQEPLPDRAASRLLVLDRATGGLFHRTVADLPDLLDPGDLVVVNRSRVFPARLLGQRPGGGSAEILLVRSHGGGVWDALVRPGRRLRPGLRIDLGKGFAATLEETTSTRTPPPLRRVRLLSADGGDPDAAVDLLGHVPLPPYIARPDGPTDRERYQTVFAHETGSVAAPTAGLHFSERLLERLRAKGVDRAEVVLHVGPGTFLPVKVMRIEDHTVPSERFELPAPAAEAVAGARARGKRVVAVGTTTTRVLETCARANRTVQAAQGETTLAILPGFPFQVVDALMTNFHLPRSSLLLLVCALAGRDRILEAYREALASGYRFYSYGDAMLIR
jgi:S-adenosylmethionine:tRNA ribosyltransferase-isomerase